MKQKKPWLVLLLMLSVISLISACSTYETEENRYSSLNGIETIYINHGSTTVYLHSGETDELQTSFVSNDNGPGVNIDTTKNQLKLSMKSDIRRLFNIGAMPTLHVYIPSAYKGKVVVEGSSGRVHVTDLEVIELDIRGKSGNVSMDFLDIKTNINVSVSSGNVNLSVRNKDTDANWLLQSNSGKRSVAFTLDHHSSTRKKTSGQTGKGSFIVDISTSSGNIRID